jgi:hypothetical protein
MTRRRVFLAGLGLLSSLLHGEIIPSDRIVNLARSGVFEDGVKGLPGRFTAYCNVKLRIPGSPLLARGDGIQDDSEAL